jgi:hypothetical protein
MRSGNNRNRADIKSATNYNIIKVQMNKKCLKLASCKEHNFLALYIRLYLFCNVNVVEIIFQPVVLITY